MNTNTDFNTQLTQLNESLTNCYELLMQFEGQFPFDSSDESDLLKIKNINTQDPETMQLVYTFFNMRNSILFKLL